MVQAASADPRPLVTVVVVNHNGQEHLAETLDALGTDQESPPSEVLVVDNASQDGSLPIAEGLAARFPHWRVLRSPSNRGYAGGVNFALPEARGRYLAVLNMDVTVTSGWLGALVDHLEGQPEVGAASPLILLAGDEKRVNAAGQDVHITALGFNRALGWPRWRVGTQPFRVSGIHGAAFIIRKEILERMGGWDESGFLYHEDVDLSWLLSLMGYEMACVPASVVRHDYVLTMDPGKLHLLERNRLAMLWLHLEAATLFWLSPALLLTEALMWGYCLLRGRKFLRAKADSYRWVAGQRRRLGQRKRFIRSIRRRRDWQVLRGMAWGYAWGQFLTLGRERGYRRRGESGAGQGVRAHG